MKRIITVVLLSVIGITGAFSQKELLGTVDFSYKYVGEGVEAMKSLLPQKMTVKLGKDGGSVAMEGGMMAVLMGKTVANDKTGKAFMIRESEKTVFLMTDDDIKNQTESVSDADITKTFEKKEILGYTCTKYIQKIKTQGLSLTYEMWLADDLRVPEYKSETFSGVLGQSKLFFNVGGFPMEVIFSMASMPVKVELSVTNIVFETVKSSEFEIPEGYEIKPFPQLNLIF